MKKEDLKLTKIYLSNIEDRIKFQKKMFSLGIQLKDNIATSLNLNDCPFFYIDEGYSLFAVESSEDGKVAFLNDDESEQVFLDDVLAIKEPKGVCKFNTFDRVLVRNSNFGQWRAKFFSHYDYENDSFPYVTTDAISFGICIKYEGNEHLLMTSDSE